MVPDSEYSRNMINATVFLELEESNQG